MSLLFPRTRHGTYRVQLAREHLDLIRELTRGIREVIADSGADGDPAVERLFPPAYRPEEAQKNAEYASLMRDDLRSGRLADLDAFDGTLDAEELTDGDLLVWLAALNDIRLFLGTRLDVTEDMEVDPDSPHAPMFSVYQFLSLLQEEVVETLQGD